MLTFRGQPFLYKNKQMPLLYITASLTSLDDSLHILNSTVMHCPQRIDPGVFGLNSEIIFFIGKDEDADVEEYSRRIFASWYMQRSAYVSIAKENQDGRVFFYSYDSFQPLAYGKNPLEVGDSTKPVSLKYVWHSSDPLMDISNLFSDRRHFKGREFRVGVVPWAHTVVGYPTPKDDPSYSNTTKYRNFYGYEISMMEIASQHLNFNYKIYTSLSEFNWLSLSSNKRTYLGIMPDVAYGVTDISVAACFASQETNNILDNLSLSHDGDVMTMVTPLPRPISKATSILKPFGVILWALTLTSLVFVAISLTVVSKIEGKLFNIPLREWTTMTNSIFFCLATITAESRESVVQLKGPASAIR